MNVRAMQRLALLLLLALVVFVIARHLGVKFDWRTAGHQMRHLAWEHVAAAVALIVGTYWPRAVRWRAFLDPEKKVSTSTLIGPQFIGFTAVSLFGRLADLVRPYLVARKVGLSLSSQVAVYTIERMFDLAAAAIIFSISLAFLPAGGEVTAAQHRVFVRASVVSLAGVLVLAGFAFAIRIAGAGIAAYAVRWGGRISARLGERVAEKVLGFRDGLNAIRSVREFLVVLAISVAMWGMIGAAYMETVHAFVDTPELAGLSYARTMLLMAASLGSSLVQLPVIGWFTYIGLTAAAMHGFYGAPIEAATACAAVLLFVLTLSIVPFGLVYARIEGVSLRGAAGLSGEAARAERTVERSEVSGLSRGGDMRRKSRRR